MIRTGVFGANGRMGQSLLTCLAETEGMYASAALVRSGHELLGKSCGQNETSLGQLLYSTDVKTALDDSDVMIDFTLPDAITQNIAACASHKKPIVIGTTGLKHEHHKLMEDLAHIVPVVYGTNMSLGVNLLNVLVEKASRALGPDFDCDIFERHHKHKKDLPSGTAITLAEHVARGRDANFQDIGTLRHDDPKPEGMQTNHIHQHGEIGLTAQRVGGVYGDHDVTFGSHEELITFSHRALNRNVFAKGALVAARWVVNQPPGLYSLKDVLNLS